MKLNEKTQQNNAVEEVIEIAQEEKAQEKVELMDTAVSEEYTADAIQVLEGLEAVRKRPGMYIGSTSQRGLHHLIYEIVDNSIDEALAGRCSHIKVTLEKDNSVTVEDNGRGIPTGINEKTGTPTVEVVFTVLHAGGKFGGGGYQISGGLHGVGASVVNALSEWVEIENCYNGEMHTERFERGFVARPLKLIGKTEKHGLTVRFKPDPEIFETIEFDYTTVLNRLREQAFLNAGLKIDLIDNRAAENIIAGSEAKDSADAIAQEASGEEYNEFEENVHYKKEESVKVNEFCYEGGISSFVEFLNSKKHDDPIHPEVIYVSVKKGLVTAEVALQYNGGYSEHLMTFANNINTIEGGTHETGFKSGITKVFVEYGKKYGYLKDGDKTFTGEDVREGLTAVVSVKLPEAQFEGQTKGKFGNSEIRPLVDGLITEKLGEFFEENQLLQKYL